MMEEKILEWNEMLERFSAEEVLAFFGGEFGEASCLSSSMGIEDQVLTDMLVRTGHPGKIITLDTGRLFPETLDLIDRTNKHYGIRIEVLFPDYQDIEGMVAEKGINLFFESIANRKLCCHMRKVEPLKRALAGMKVWITGIRKDQTLDRFNTRLVEWDDGFQIVKVNPLYRWTEKKVWEYIRTYDVPYSELYDKGFRSIGCQPCTRPVRQDEDPRAGRWWWEDQGHKECGLHIKE